MACSTATTVLRLGDYTLAAQGFAGLSGEKVGLFTNSLTAPLVAINFYALDAVRRLSGRNLVAEAVQARRNLAMFDKINGTDRVRKALLAGESAEAIVSSWKGDEALFRERRKEYLLY